MPSSTLNILGLCGSLRADSLNRKALQLAGQRMPTGMQLTVAELGDIPLYNADVQAHGMPASVQRLADAIGAADGVLIATPEYNFSVPGVLKNAIDWVSRVPDQPFSYKPVALLSASMGPLGGARVQYDLRKIMVFLNALVLNKPEVFIGAAHTKFDAAGHVTDAATDKFVTEQMAAFQLWVQRAQRAAA